MPDTSTRFDFKKRVAYDPDAKRRFHRHARAQLLKLAEALGLEPHEFDLRSNEGGIAVSGEITMHADRLYVQASQSAMGADTGILFRSCEGRRVPNCNCPPDAIAAGASGACSSCNCKPNVRSFPSQKRNACLNEGSR